MFWKIMSKAQEGKKKTSVATFYFFFCLFRFNCTPPQNRSFTVEVDVAPQ